MNRLSVRISIVVAVLILGSAAIAYSVMSKGEPDAKVAKTGGSEPGKPKKKGPLKPIPSSEAPSSPASSARRSVSDFPPPSGLRTVSHENGLTGRAGESDNAVSNAVVDERADAGGGAFSIEAIPSDPTSSTAPTAASSTTDSLPSAGPAPLPDAALGAPTQAQPIGASDLGSLNSQGERPLRPRGALSDGGPAQPSTRYDPNPPTGPLQPGPLQPSPLQPSPIQPGPLQPGPLPAETGAHATDTIAVPDSLVGRFAPVESAAPTHRATGGESTSPMPGYGADEAAAPRASKFSLGSGPRDPGLRGSSGASQIDRDQRRSDPNGQAGRHRIGDSPLDSTGSPGTGARGFGGPSTAMSGVGRSMTGSSLLDSRAVESFAANAGPESLLASDRPGSPRLEGQQTPAITLEKLAPDEIQVNREATFRVRVQNGGNAAAHELIVIDRIPQGTEFLDASPDFQRTADGLIIWQLGTLEPGDQVVLSMQLMPKAPGEIGSVAKAMFQTQASVRTVCTKPSLDLQLKAVESVLIGQTMALELVITNTGDGAASDVVVEEDVPEGLVHAAGHELEHAIGTLQPQESRRLTLQLDAVKPGIYTNHLVVRGAGKLMVDDVRQIEVVAPQLTVQTTGPTLRYLDRQATYTIRMSNAGTAAARNVELSAFLPKGMRFVTSDHQGQYDSQTHAVYWSLEELPATNQGTVQVTVLPVEPGSQRLKVDAKADLDLVATDEYEVVVDSLSELTFSIDDVADPIEVGTDTTYEIIVRNRGSKADGNVLLVAELPAGLVPTSGDGPTRGTVQGQIVQFAPLERISPGEEAVYKIRAQGNAVGDHIIRARVQSNELPVPVTKEEGTRVYSDSIRR